MRAATPDRPRTRPGRGWYVGAVLSAVVAVTMCLLGWRQADQADRINAHPVRIEGTVTQLPGGSGTYSQVAYAADGRKLTAADLWLPAEAKVGDRICLEHAADDAGAVRVCGKRYPQPVGVGLAQTTVPLAVLLCLGCLLRIRHFRRAHPVAGREGTPGFTVAFAAEGMPAITQGKRTRRRRKGGRRALR
ncbi:hypothetical protein [Kitasatospora cheerisanensis]|uniref:Uncharacterized protein n=1 Tax=Kitasatospora cheerisanensis KCTC 2395 TaxID=1348663 RepID=A0A066Z0D7_9ACTN|nr:hypothetical protein [Kitasatospora cheerisanensis]KDN83806.1 hypothetical protein KCH_44550 [Kitasatospora cheerisanensis KCTC 2395]